MRLEDKELEGPDLEREQGLEQLEDETHENDKALPELAGPEVIDAELSYRTRMFDALQSILAGEDLSIPMLYLPQREALALEALQSAVTGRDRSMNTFMFAEDRKSLLEQALAVLQQNLTRGDSETLSVLHAKYDELTENVANLRDELLGLEDAQDDLIEQKQREEEITSGDAPETEDADSATGFIASALGALAEVAQVERAQPFRSTLVGPELPEATKGASTLDGPEVTRAAKPTSLAGPDLPAPAPHVSLLDAPGPDATTPEHVSTLDGPEVLAERPPSSLYTEGVDELLVPPHLRPRLAADQPVGMRTDDHQERAFAPHVDDGRGPAPPTSADRQRERDAPLREPTGNSQPAIASRTSEPALASRGSEPAELPVAEEPPKPAGRRGLSVRSSEKPGKKK